MLNDKILKMEGKIQDLTLTVSKMEEDKLRRETEFHESLKIEKDRLAQVNILLQYLNLQLFCVKFIQTTEMQ